MKELDSLLLLQKDFPDQIRLNQLTEVRHGSRVFPIHAIYLGPTDPSLPVYGLFAGVHGLERIGVELCLYYLRCLCEQLKWDQELQGRLKTCRIVGIPIINPFGINDGTRSNANGVDLMRNAPIDSEGYVPFLMGGHRISPRIPWFRGRLGQEMEAENQTLVEFVKKELFPAPLAMALDLHSGFGFRDRLWYPYAVSNRDFPRIQEAKRIEDLFIKSYPNHVYQVEATSGSYQVHGDVWDYLVELQKKEYPDKVFIPWTLELGSWMWIRKNPFQFFSSIGIFHPIKLHRAKRVMRRHQAMMDFLWRMTAQNRAWTLLK